MTVPTQAEIEALSRELMEGPIASIEPDEVADRCRRAALMIARLERAWLNGGAESLPQPQPCRH